MAQKPWKGDFEDLKSKTFPWGACSRGPRPRNLRFRCSFRKSASIYSRFAPTLQVWVLQHITGSNLFFFVVFFLAPSGSGQYHVENKTSWGEKIDLSVPATLVDEKTQVKDTVRYEYSIELQVKLLIKSSFSPSTIARSGVVSHDFPQEGKAKECNSTCDIIIY